MTCHRRGGGRAASVAVLFSLLGLLWPAASPASAVALDPAPQAKATITFDVTTGSVLSASNDRTPMRVASTFKVLTALVVRANLALDADIPVSARAEAVPPLKLSMPPGTRWNVNALMHAMLIASINDAAISLAEAAGGGSLSGFARALAAESRRLGLSDHPRLHDPAGLDDASSVAGGNLISARDLAIATRAFLSDPYLAGIVRLPTYRFLGGDGKPHVVYNHNAFLQTYPDAIGVKTGYTERSGHSLIAAAQRDGRTLAVVVIGSSDPVGVASAKLDAAFAAGAKAPGTGDRLGASGLAPTVIPAASGSAATAFHALVPPVSPPSDIPAVVVAGFAVVVAVLAGRVLQVKARRRRH